jgi:hypothetical protein
MTAGNVIFAVGAGRDEDQISLENYWKTAVYLLHESLQMSPVHA